MLELSLHFPMEHWIAERRSGQAVMMVCCAQKDDSTKTQLKMKGSLFFAFGKREDSALLELLIQLQAKNS